MVGEEGQNFLVLHLSTSWAVSPQRRGVCCTGDESTGLSGVGTRHLEAAVPEDPLRGSANLQEYASVNLALPRMPTRMEKEEESVQPHKQDAAC
uniref:Uncharacterized protein n=1 Tax=Urocitellus parryii TaxID=9999 RepID=A0A8D2GTZ5_UROPR